MNVRELNNPSSIENGLFGRQSYIETIPQLTNVELCSQYCWIVDNETVGE